MQNSQLSLLFRSKTALQPDRGRCALAIQNWFILAETANISEPLSWFAIRVFRNRLAIVRAEIETSGREIYQPMKIVDKLDGGRMEYKQVPLIPSVLFLKSDMAFMKDLRYRHFGELMVYCNRPGTEPARISDAQMEAFMMVTSPRGNHKITYLPDGEDQYKKGDPVRVIDGFYKGVTGVVRRIKKDRKLLVAIEGVAVVAVSDIPIEFLEKI